MAVYPIHYFTNILATFINYIIYRMFHKLKRFPILQEYEVTRWEDSVDVVCVNKKQKDRLRNLK